jgi:peptidoglycan/xylan/chitin deacetylase (PgdA/CDA1 family)
VKGDTVVSLTFDDGSASQYDTLDILSSHHMNATFYINTAMVNSSPYYMTWPQVAELAAEGNEIAGHTLHHVNLTAANPAKERSEVCDDRQALVAGGFGGVSFAYPEGALDARAESDVRSCGYQNARLTGGLWYPGCASCPAVETMLPANRYAIRTAPPVTTATTLADLQASVTTAEAHGGGWVPMVFHGICDNRCTAENSLRPAVFTAFLDWLAPRTRKGTVVRTVAQVMSAVPQPR